MKSGLVTVLVLVMLSVVSARYAHHRIVNGLPAVRGQAPYQVSLRTLTNHHFCGGAVLTQRWVLTAGHCTAGRYPGEFVAVVGSLLRTEGVSHVVEKMFLHKDFSANLLSNDIALLQTETNIAFNILVQPVRMAAQAVSSNNGALLTGWGQTTFPGELSDTLQAISMITLDHKQCEAAHSDSEGHPPVTESNICATTENEGGACMGDSGSPLVDETNGIIGLVSWGVPCAKNSPDVFTRVSFYREWIIETVAKNS